MEISRLRVRWRRPAIPSERLCADELCNATTALGYWPACALIGRGDLYYDTFNSLSIVAAVSFWLTAAFRPAYHRDCWQIPLVLEDFCLTSSNLLACQPDQLCETAIECDTSGFGRCPDRSDRPRRPARHVGAVRTGSRWGVSFVVTARG